MSAKLPYFTNLKKGEVPVTVPTQGFNVERIQHNDLDLTIWDIGGHEKMKKLRYNYFNNIDAIIYVIDSSDDYRIDIDSEDIH